MAARKQATREREPNDGGAAGDPEQARRRITETRDRMSATLDRLGEQLEQKSEEIRQKVDIAGPARERVRANPLPTLGIAFAAGVVVGLLRGGRDSDGEEAEQHAVEYIEPVPRPSYPEYELPHAGRHGFLLELRSVLMHQIGNAIVGAIAGVISARLSRHRDAEPPPSYFDLPR